MTVEEFATELHSILQTEGFDTSVKISDIRAVARAKLSEQSDDQYALRVVFERLLKSYDLLSQ